MHVYVLGVKELLNQTYFCPTIDWAEDLVTLISKQGRSKGGGLGGLKPPPPPPPPPPPQKFWSSILFIIDVNSTRGTTN